MPVFVRARHRWTTTTFGRRLAFAALLATAFIATVPGSAAHADQGQAIVNAAASMAGKPYCWAGGNEHGPSSGTSCPAGTTGFDCTGLAIYAVFQATGISGLPHGAGNAWAQRGTQIARAQLQPGDVIFFGGSGFHNFTHAGIYAGDGEMWHAPDHGKPVQKQAVAWVENALPFVGAVRYRSSAATNPPSADPKADGAFVRTPDGAIHRVVGDAALHVASCEALDGCPNVIQISNLSGYSTGIAGGRFVRVANGSKQGRIARSVGGALLHVASCEPLGGCPGLVGIDEYAYDRYVERHPAIASGAFIRIANGSKNGWISRAVGGSLLHLGSCEPVVGCGGAVEVDEYAYDRYVERHLDIASGAFIRVANGSKNGWISRAVGGSLLHLGSCEPVVGCGGAVEVDEYAYDRYDEAHRSMADGAFVRVANGSKNGVIARAVGGALLHVATCAPLDGCSGTVDVDEHAYDQYSANHRDIADGAYVRVANGTKAGWIARAAGGALLHLTTCAVLQGCPGWIGVDEYAFDRYRASHQAPANGTVLRGLPSGSLWVVSEGKRRRTMSQAGAVDLDDGAVSSVPAAAAPGAVGPQSSGPVASVATGAKAGTVASTTRVSGGSSRGAKSPRSWSVMRRRAGVVVRWKAVRGARSYRVTARFSGRTVRRVVRRPSVLIRTRAARITVRIEVRGAGGGTVHTMAGTIRGTRVATP